MKRLFSTILTVVLAVACSLSLFACNCKGCNKDTIDVEITFNKAGEDVKVTYTLYNGLAPESVDAFIKLAESGYYNDTVMFRSDVIGKGTFSFGQYKFVDGKLEILPEDDLTKTITGEFPKGGVKGSDLKAYKGNMFINRWNNADGSLETSGYNSGSASIINISTDSSSYDDAQNDGTLVAVFGVFAEDSKDAIYGLLDTTSNSWKADNTEAYYIFYLEDENGEPLTDAMILTEDEYDKEVVDGVIKLFDEENNSYTVNNVFDPAEYEGDNAVYKLNKYKTNKITVPNADNRITVKSIAVK